MGWPWITGWAFAAPAWLWALVVLAAFPRTTFGAVRALGFAAIVIALAQPVATIERSARAVLVDLSASVDRSAQADAVASWVAEWAGDAPVDMWGFASDVTRLGADATEPAGLDRSTTDLTRALTVVAGTGPDRILLLSDGGFGAADVAAFRSPVPIDVVYVRPADNVGIEGIRVPRTRTPGSPVAVDVDIRSDVATTVRLSISIGGVVARARDLTVEPGTTTVRDIVDTTEAGPGDLTIEVSIATDLTQPTADDVASTTIVATDRGAIWVVGDDALADRLERGGLAIERRSAADVRAPITASAVVIRSDAAAFTSSQLEQISDWVESGGGLWMTGGPTSFGLGGWQRTPVDTLLPVDSDVPDEAYLPLVGLVLVLDVSQSMDVGSPTKISLARRGAAEVVDLAYERDLVGLVAFSDTSRWAFTLRPATSRGKLEMAQAIASLTADGGTVLRPGLSMAIEALADSEAVVRHVIVLSDGRLSEAGTPFGSATDDLGDVALRAADASVTVSTIALGDDADVATLQRLAATTGGRSIVVEDAASLPRAFASEAFAATRPLLREGRASASSDPHPLSSGLVVAPTVDAYVATRAKPDAEVVFGFQGAESLLAVRRVGLGRTAALTTDVAAWSGPWGASPDSDEMFVRVASWLAARPDRYGSDLSTNDGSVTLTVDAIEQGSFRRGLDMTAVAAGRTVGLAEVGPGRYAADLGALAPGTSVVVSEGGEVVARSRFEGAGVEFGQRDGSAVLERIAATSGGIPWRPGDGAVQVDPGRAARATIWPLLVFASAALALAWSTTAIRDAWSRRRPAARARNAQSSSDVSDS